MDQNNVAVAALSIPDATATLSGNDGRALCRAMNVELAATVAAHPSGFGAFACLPMDDMDAAIKSLAHALDVLHMDGAAVATHHHGRYLGDKTYEPPVRRTRRTRDNVACTSNRPPGFDARTSIMEMATLEFIFQTIRIVTNMVLSGTKQRFDKVNAISTHAGGTIPFLANRISAISQMPTGYTGGTAPLPQKIIEGLGTFYYDLTASTSPTPLDAILRLVKPSQLLMDFDFPVKPPRLIALAIEDVATYAEFEDIDRGKISSENARGLSPVSRVQFDRQ